MLFLWILKSVKRCPLLEKLNEALFLNIRYSYKKTIDTLRESDSIRDLGSIKDKRFSFSITYRWWKQSSKKKPEFLAAKTQEASKILTWEVCSWAWCNDMGSRLTNTEKSTRKNWKSFFLYFYFKLFGCYPTDLPYDELFKSLELLSLDPRLKRTGFLFPYSILCIAIEDIYSWGSTPLQVHTDFSASSEGQCNYSSLFYIGPRSLYNKLSAIKTGWHVKISSQLAHASVDSNFNSQFYISMIWM